MTFIEASDVDVLFGDSAVLVATLHNESGSVLSGFDLSVVFNGNDAIYTTDLSGQIRIDIPDDLDEGLYPVLIGFDSQGLLKGCLKTVYVNVSRFVTFIEASDVDVLYGDSVSLVATLYNESGSVLSGFDLSVVFNGNASVYTTDSNGQIRIEVPDDLDEGIYPVAIGFDSHGLLKSCIKTVYVNVIKYSTRIDASDIGIVFGDEAYLVATLFDEFDNSLYGFDLFVMIYGDGPYNYTTDSVGQIRIPLSDWEEGFFSVYINFYGKDYYGESLKTVNVTVNKFNSYIDVSDISILYGNSANLIATLYDEFDNALSSYELYAEINGTNMTYLTDENGQIVISVPSLDEGIHALSVGFPSQSCYRSSFKVAYVNVSKYSTRIDATDMAIVYGDDAYLLATLFNESNDPLAHFALSVNVDGDNMIYATDDNGQISIPLSNLEEGLRTISISFNPMAIYNASSKTVYVDVIKYSTQILASDLNLFYGEAASLQVSFLNQSGSVLSGFELSVEFNGTVKTYATDSHGQFNVPIPILPEGIYPLKIDYVSDNAYSDASKTVYVNVSKSLTHIEASDIGVIYGDSVYLIATLYNASNLPLSGFMIFANIDGVISNYTTGNDGEIAVPIPVLKAGTYPIQLSFDSTDYYSQCSKTVNLYVRQIITLIDANDISAYYGEGKLDVALRNETGEGIISQSLTLSINNENQSLDTDSNGNASFDLNLPGGDYNATLIFDGTELYAKANRTIHIHIEKFITKLVYDTIAYKYDEDGEISVKLTDGDGNPIENAYLYLTADFIDNGTFQTDGKGEISFTLDKNTLSPDNYSFNLDYYGNNKYHGSSAQLNFTVDKLNTIVLAENMTTSFASDDVFAVTLKDERGNPLEGRTIKFNASREGSGAILKYATTDSNGQALFMMNAIRLPASSYAVSVSFAGEEFYHSGFIIVNILVNQASISHDDPIDNSSINPGGNSGETPIDNAQSGSGTGSSNGGYSGGLSGSSTESSLSSSTVKIPTSFYVPMLVAVYNSGGILTATLNDENGNPVPYVNVIIRIGGRNFYRTTDAKGQVNLLISLEPKIYFGTVYFGGNGKYQKTSAEAQVIVEKIKTKISASKKTFKVKTKTKKYTITLRNAYNKAIKNAVIYLKVKGKTYKAKTNSAGKATFKITNLNRKSRIKAFVQFKGNKFYSHVSKTVKLLVK